MDKPLAQLKQLGLICIILTGTLLLVNPSKAGLGLLCQGGELKDGICHCSKDEILDGKIIGICKTPPIRCPGFPEDKKGNCICPIAHDKKEGTCVLNEAEAKRIKEEGAKALKKLKQE